MHIFTQNLKWLLRMQSINTEIKIVNQFLFLCSRTYSKNNYKLIIRKPIINTPKIMKLETAQFKSCITEEVKTLQHLFAGIGHEIRIVGGAVRDLLMGIQPMDLDFATTATPDEMKLMFTSNEIRLINLNGEKHGTITCRINEKNFEITTLRVDIATDGRHAEVQFTQDWILDANRRDLTVNAMYLGLDGTLYDYFSGYEDLKNKRVLFVGDAAARIQEDYLRILRYFRFYGKISEVPDSHNEDVLKAIKENSSGLNSISGERIWIELNKILKGRFVAEIIIKMISLGIGPYIGFPKNYNEAEFKCVCDRIKTKDLPVQPVTLLSALFNNEEELNNFFLRIKPSGAERNLGLFILENRKNIYSDTIRPYKVLRASTQQASFVYELLKYQGMFDFLEELRNWNIPKFPVNGHMLKELGVKAPDIGTILSTLKQIWFEHDFNISAEKLLKYVSEELITTKEQPEKKRRK